MAKPAAANIEVRAGGSNLNGGGFLAGGGGTDRTLQDAPHVTFDGVTITAVTSGVSATITITGYTVIAGDKDNYLRIASGTNFTGGIYHIVSVDTGANTWTMDANVASGVGAAMVGRMGGAVGTVKHACESTTAVASNAVWVKNEGTDHEASAGITQLSGVNTSTCSLVRGYGTTRGDSTKAVLKCTAASVTIFAGANNASIENLDLRGNGQTTSKGAALVGTGQFAIDCKFSGFSSSACNVTQDRSGVYGCEITTSTGSTAALVMTLGKAVGCHIHGNANHGVLLTDSDLINCVVVDNTGASNDGVVIVHGSIVSCTIANNGRDNINGSGTVRGNVYWNNVLAFPVRYNINQVNWLSGGASYYGYYQKNFFWVGAGTENINGMVVGGTNVVLTADPFTDENGGDYTLNNTAGGGAAVRGVGYPTSVPPGTMLAYPDGGALQHQDAGSGTTVVSAGLTTVVLHGPGQAIGY